jgi:hypothetical protein
LSLTNVFKINFSLMQIHKQSLSDIENMIPWERDLFVEQLRQHMEEQNLKTMQARVLNRR